MLGVLYVYVNILKIMNKVNISVIIPTFNRANSLEKVLDSFLSQTYSNWECLIIDDFSTDNTKDIVIRYCNLDHRFRYIVNSHTKGAQGARNTGLFHSHGDWIAFFDSDDLALPEMLKSLYSKTHVGADVITSKAQVLDYISSNPKFVADWRASGNDVLKKILKGDAYVNFNGCLIRKTKLLSVGGVDERCVSHQEMDLHIRLSQISKYSAVDNVLSLYYVGSKDAISSNVQKHIEGLIYIVHKYGVLWRKVAYRHFLYRINTLWNLSFSIPSGIKYRTRLLIIAPEFIVYRVYKRFFVKHI